MTDEHRANLVAPGPTLLPEDHPDVAARAALAAGEDAVSVLTEHPSSSYVWAAFARGALATGTAEGAIAAYAYARTGYHRGLDALRKAGWRGQGPIPTDHLPNQGFLLSVLALEQAAAAIGEIDEAERCERLLLNSGTSAIEVAGLLL
jgi:hypothetical protein